MEPRFKKEEGDKNPIHVLQCIARTEVRLGKCPVVCFPAQGRVGKRRLSSAALKMPLLLQPSGNTCQLVSQKGYPTLLWSELLYHSSTTRCPAILQRILNQRKDVCLLALQSKQPRGGTTGPQRLERMTEGLRLPALFLGYRKTPAQSSFFLQLRATITRETQACSEEEVHQGEQ